MCELVRECFRRTQSLTSSARAKSRSRNGSAVTRPRHRNWGGGVTEGLGPDSAAPRATPDTVPGGCDKELGIQACAHRTPTLLSPIIRILERKTEAKEQRCSPLPALCPQGLSPKPLHSWELACSLRATSEPIWTSAQAT